MVAADAGANDRRAPALTPDRKTFSGCICAFLLPASPTIAVTSVGVYASKERSMIATTHLGGNGTYS